MPKVYIIIVNYKGWEDTIECLESLLKLSYTNFQIVVIDNSPDLNSADKICEWAHQGLQVKSAFPDYIFPMSKKPCDFAFIKESSFAQNNFSSKIILVKADQNNGFSQANNLGLKYALKASDFKFAWLLNNDTVVDPRSLLRLIECMSISANRRVGILGAKVMEYENAEIIQSAGGGRLIKPIAYSKLIGAGERDDGQFDVSTMQLDFIAGTCMFVRKEFLTEVGLMGEEYFLYFEEPDWAERAKKFNWEIDYCYQAMVFHKGGASTGGKGYSSLTKGSTDFSDYYFQRAKILFTRKHYWYWIPSVYLSFVLVMLNRIKRGQFHRIKYLLAILINPFQKFRGKT